MANEPFILLDQQGTNGSPFLVPGQLRGQPFYRAGPTGYADSVQEVQAAGLHRVPTFLLLRGRSLVTVEKPEQSPEWSNWYDANHERITLKDTHGAYGPRNGLIVADLVNAPFFSDDHVRVRAAVLGNRLVDCALVFDRKDKKERLALNRLAYEGVVGEHDLEDHFFTSYEKFREASATFTTPDGNFIDANLSYLVIRPVAEAREQSPSGYRAISVQRTNPEIIIAAGGVQPANALLDKAEALGYTAFGAWNDGYQQADGGRVVAADSLYDGILGDLSLGSSGRSVGVAPEALNAFYKALREGGLEKKVR